MVVEDEDEGTLRDVAGITVTSSGPSAGASWFSEWERLPSIVVGPLDLQRWGRWEFGCL